MAPLLREDQGGERIIEMMRWGFARSPILQI
jgi:hypothetical protein